MEELKLLKEQIVEAVEQLNENAVLKLAEQALQTGIEPRSLLETVNEGMRRVGVLYEKKSYFIADLIMAGVIFKELLELDKMTEQFRRSTSRKIGKVVVGTVRGDLHSIGKDIFRGMMETNGFEAIDLGVDVTKEAFVKKVSDVKPDILALGGVLTSTVDVMKEVVEALEEAGVRRNMKVIIGGSHLTNEACICIGADAFANDATFGVKTCITWIKKEDQGSN